MEEVDRSDMVFSGSVFLFAFLPLFFMIYYLLPGLWLKNLWLLVASLYFYGYGEPVFVVLMILSILVNYALGYVIHRYCRKRTVRKGLWILAIGFNFILLFVFKYLDFFVGLMNELPGVALPLTRIPLPIGISFFTFQAYSYVYDIYAHPGEGEYVQKSPFKLGLYISMFPQLIAGPIVRYSDIAREIDSPGRIRLSEISGGIGLFVIGLSKKLLLANTMGIVSAEAFATPQADAGAGFLYLGAISYAFQIYFDFSGYSDMARGLGKMMGFHFKENFHYPYMSTSVTEFWRRWHISLSRWFRDYLYIPLGGSRGGAIRTFRNLFIVWLFTGLWHGANFTFVLWGLMYFVFLMGEKLVVRVSGKPIEELLPPLLTRLYTLLVVLFCWVMFNAPSPSAALGYMAGMMDWGNAGSVPGRALFYLHTFRWEYLVCLFASTDLPRRGYDRLKRAWGNCLALWLLETGYLAVLMGLCLLYIMKGSFNPFIYFNF